MMPGCKEQRGEDVGKRMSLRAATVVGVDPHSKLRLPMSFLDELIMVLSRGQDGCGSHLTQGEQLQND